MAHGGRKNADEALAAALAAGRTVRGAAAALGVSERTAYRRMADPAFRARVNQRRAEMIGTALGRMTDGMRSAATKLRKLLRARDERVQLGAARALLELGVRLRDSVELEARLAELERKLNAKGKT